MESFPSNSHNAKPSAEPEREKIEKVVTGEVNQRKKPLGKRFAETFVGGDAKSTMLYVVFDILVPAAKDMAADAVSQGIERMIFGESRTGGRSSSRRSSSGSNGFVSYNRFGPNNQRRGEREEPRGMSRKARATHDFDEIVCATRIEADLVIERLYDLLSRYEQVTVADLYDLVGITGSYTDNKWGWTRLDGARAIRDRNGYLLDLPKPEPIE